MPPANKTKISETFTPEEQKQFDSMKEADKTPDAVESKPADTQPPSPPTPQPEPQNSSPETKETKEIKEAKEPKENTMVPHAALEAERQRRKAAEQRDRDREIEFVKLQERITLINQAMEANQNKEPAKPQKLDIPDPEKDALGAVKAMAHNEKLTQQEINVLREYKETRDKQDSERQQVSALTSWAAQQEREFAAKTPEYNEASAYLMNSRFNELTLAGLPPDQAQNQMMREIVDVARICKTNGKNPAELTLAFAKARGYQPKPPAQQPNEQPAAKEVAAPSAAEQIDKLNAAQRANRSLSEASGNAPPGKIQAKDLAAMSDEQFSKMLKNMSPQDQREYFGD